MKKFIKLGVLGLALSLSLTACKYEKQEELLRANDNQATIGLVLGDSHISYIYNVKKPQDVYLYAPTGFKVLLGNEKQEYYKKHIEPQEMINLKFKILKDGEDIKNAEEVDKLIFTFKEDYNPENKQSIYRKSGKSTNRVGDKSFFKASPTQKDILIELHEYNQGWLHEFYYKGVENNIKFKLIAPKYHSFIFSSKAVKEYSFNMKKDSEVEFTMQLKADWADSKETYVRQYKVKTNK